MQGLKRWAPVIGSALLAAPILLRIVGQDHAAQAVETVGGLTGYTDEAGISQAELAGAIAAVTGVALKVRSQVQKARTNK